MSVSFLSWKIPILFVPENRCQCLSVLEDSDLSVPENRCQCLSGLEDSDLSVPVGN